MDNIIEDIKTKLEEFKKIVPSFQFTPSRRVYPYKEYKDDPNKYFFEKWPNADEPGVYVFISSANKKPLYVGKSEAYLGNRIYSHLGKIDKDDKKLFPHAEEWAKANIEELCFITIPIQPFWLAPALESFLIHELKPEYNKQGFNP